MLEQVPALCDEYADGLNQEWHETLREQRQLDKQLFLELVRWKSPRITSAADETEERVEAFSRAAFEYVENGRHELALALLLELRGVRVPVASAILTHYDPADYGVMDYRVKDALAQLYGYEIQETGTEIQQYSAFLQYLRQISAEEGLTVRETEYRLWLVDKEDLYTALQS